MEQKVELDTGACRGNVDDATISDASSRRFNILRRLAKSDSGTISVEELRRDRNFTRRYKHAAKSTLEADFAELVELVGRGRTLIRTRSGLRLIACADPMAANLESNGSTAHPNQASTELENKKQIGRFVSELLADTSAGNEVLYLSTGSTVYEVASSLFIDHPQKVRVVLTDNFAIACLLWQLSRRDDLSRGTQLYILGGILDFEKADVMQSRGKGQLDNWQCSTAVVSATGVNPRTGQIYSFRQPETKSEFFKDASVQRVIIPVTADKFKVPGGWLIYDPKDADPETRGRKYEIVTTQIEPSTLEQLKKHYDVHIVSQRSEMSRIDTSSKS